MFGDADYCTCGMCSSSQIFSLNPGEVWMADISSGVFLSKELEVLS